MGHPPESFLKYYVQRPDPTIRGYLAEIVAQASTSDVIFTDSLRDQNRPIISPDQFNAATDLTAELKGGSNILQVSEHTILKVGWRVHMGEAEALILLAERSQIPVPEVLSAYTIGDIGFILMTKIDGQTLGSCMDSMSPEDLSAISCQLKAYILEWRAFHSSFLGSVGGGPCQDIIFQHPWDYRSTRKYGPFDSFEQYKHGVVEALRASRPNDSVWHDEEEALKQKILTASPALADERSTTTLGVLTHGDVHPGNIMVKNGVITGILDWGDSGYSLPEREFFAAKRIAMDERWAEMIDKCIPFFSEQCALMDEVDRSMMRYSPV
ncbi:aminoglycoside phosphotransferase family protein [Aspergillus lucknowensis]|uniref:Kinase-like domain-containing protein n=1 Tax=Aspergillus lucknowensis TaxID=176173 RepID=A0ABR4LID9_9EURO